MTNPIDTNHNTSFAGKAASSVRRVASSIYWYASINLAAYGAALGLDSGFRIAARAAGTPVDSLSSAADSFSALPTTTAGIAALSAFTAFRLYAHKSDPAPTSGRLLQAVSDTSKQFVYANVCAIGAASYVAVAQAQHSLALPALAGAAVLGVATLCSVFRAGAIDPNRTRESELPSDAKVRQAFSSIAKLASSAVDSLLSKPAKTRGPKM
jgi:hypothetical protein